MTDKLCKKCGLIWPLTGRYWQRDTTNPTGYNATCKACRRAHDRARDAIRNQSRTRRLQLAAATANRRARQQGIAGRLTRRVLVDHWQRQRGRCEWCKEPLGASYQVDHIHPLGTAYFCGDNSPANVCITCPDCNRKKGGMRLIHWLGVLAARGIYHALQPADMPIQRPLQPDPNGGGAKAA